MENTPLYIKSIKIKNLFGDRDVVWDLRKDVNILGGPNGSGKSTILKAVYELLSKGKIEDERSIKLIRSIEIVFTNNKSIKWPYKGPFNTDSIQYNQDGGVYTQNDLLKLIDVCFINSFEQRISDAIKLSKLPDYDLDGNETYLDKCIEEELTKRNESYFHTLESMIFPSKEKEYVDLLTTHYVDYLFELKLVCNIFLPNYRPVDFTKLIFLKGNSYIPYQQMSMGEKQMLLVLLKVLNTQKRPAIFIMDEPDLGMHVDWKKKLLKELRNLNPNMQLIVSTHAPSMVTGFGECVKEIGQITNMVKEVANEGVNTAQ